MFLKLLIIVLEDFVVSFEIKRQRHSIVSLEMFLCILACLGLKLPGMNPQGQP